MAAKTLRELFVEELRDIYDGEKQLTRALPKMAKAVESEELRTAITEHLRETETQIQRVEQILESLGEAVRGKKCEGMQGLIEEGKEKLEELDGSLLDAAVIASAQKVEHYEIATYGTLAYMADLLGESEAKALLGETLEEEKAADEKLNGIAKSQVNRDALTEAGEEEEEDEEPRRRTQGSTSGRAASRATGSRKR